MINPENCLNCNDCNVASLCPQKAVIREMPCDKPWIDFLQCRGCMECMDYCNNKAVLKEVKPCNGFQLQTW
jgi:Pyruvate/2-oxoacid:ferredoxin oxidoreductase delta subunit